MIHFDTIDAVLCEDDQTVVLEAFAGDHTVDRWSFTLASPCKHFQRRVVARKARELMRTAPAGWQDQMANWLNRRRS